MSLIQTRPKDLVLYVQEDVGHPDYVDPSELQFLIDHSSFAKPKRWPQTSMSGATGHTEEDTLTGLSSRSVSVTFDAAFTTIPRGLNRLSVYRMTEVITGEFVMEQVMFHYTSATPVTTTGFDLEIDTSESLTGIIIEYEFKGA